MVRYLTINIRFHLNHNIKVAEHHDERPLNDSGPQTFLRCFRTAYDNVVSNGSFEFVEADACQLPFASNSFDKIMAFKRR